MGIIMKDGHQYGIGGIERAEDVSYDNTESGMTATDVQGALDELSAGLMLSASVVYCNQNWQNVHTVNMPAGIYYVIIMNESSLYTGISWGTGAFAFTPIATGSITSVSGNNYTVTINTSNRGACVVMFPLNN